MKSSKEIQRFHVYGSVWNYGDEIDDLKGTARTLDNADGAVELESGILSKVRLYRHG